MRPAIERYVRAVVEANGIELVLGVQYDNAVEYMGLLAVSKMLLRDAVDSLDGSHAVTNPAMLAEAVEAKVKEQWPERLFFLEVCSASERDGWVQVYSGQASKLEERISRLEHPLGLPAAGPFQCLFCGREYPRDGYCAHGAK